ncbi:MAG: hypothetical protein ACHQKY_10700 [Terriglobia bacterium]
MHECTPGGSAWKYDKKVRRSPGLVQFVFEAETKNPRLRFEPQAMRRERTSARLDPARWIYYFSHAGHLPTAKE